MENLRFLRRGNSGEGVNVVRISRELLRECHMYVRLLCGFHVT